MRTARIACTALVAAALMLAATTAWAVEWGMSDSTLEDLSHDATQSLLIRKILQDAQTPGRSTPAPTARRTTLAPAGPGTSMARRLAATYPADRRAEMERAFDQLLRQYHEIEDRFGVARFDVGGSVAAFIAGGLMAYRNEPFPDAYFKPLVEQMRGVVASDPGFARASPLARREMYEQMAILGMSMATAQATLARQPDPRIEANMRRSARSQLERFLHADPDRIQITDRGMVIR